MLNGLSKKLKNILNEYWNAELFLLSIEPCKKGANAHSPPGFSHHELYPNDPSSLNYNLQLYLRPHFLLYLQIFFFLILSIAIVFSSAETLKKSILVAFLFSINFIYYKVAYDFFLKKEIFIEFWNDESSNHLKHWFKQIPQKITLKKPSDNIWFRKKTFHPKKNRLSANFNKSWSPQKDFYKKSLYYYINELEKEHSFYPTLILLSPIIANSIFFIFIILYDSFFLTHCGYTSLSINILPAMLLWFFFFSTNAFILKYKSIKFMKEEIFEGDNTTPPSHFKVPYENYKKNSPDYNLRRTIVSDKKHTKIFTIENKFISFAHGILFATIVGLANIQSMHNTSNECNSKPPPLTLVHKR